jgi:hypothetical protein
MNLFDIFQHYLQLRSFIKIYICRGHEKSLISLNRLQHGFLGHAPTIILTIVTCEYLSPVG